MSEGKRQVPTEVAEWAATQLEIIARGLRASRTTVRQHPDDLERWVLGIVPAAKLVEEASAKLLHLLVDYGIQSGATRPARIAAAVDLPISSIQSMRGNKTTTQARNEVWPSPE